MTERRIVVVKNLSEGTKSSTSLLAVWTRMFLKLTAGKHTWYDTGEKGVVKGHDTNLVGKSTLRESETADWGWCREMSRRQLVEMGSCQGLLEIEHLHPHIGHQCRGSAGVVFRSFAGSKLTFYFVVGIPRAPKFGCISFAPVLC